MRGFGAKTRTGRNNCAAVKGQVMRMLLDTDHSDGFDQFDHVIYDRTAGIHNDGTLYAVAASSYVAQFASDVGATLKSANGSTLALKDAVLHRPDGSEIKQLEAFFGWIHAAPGGTLCRRSTTRPRPRPPSASSA